MQDLRKQADFDIADRIRLYVSATPVLSQAIQAHREYLMGETLTVDLRTDTAPTDSAPSAQAEFDGEKVSFAIEKA